MYLKSPGRLKRFRIGVIVTAALAVVGVSACVQPERVEVLEREQRRIQNDNLGQQKEMTRRGPALRILAPIYSRWKEKSAV